MPTSRISLENVNGRWVGEVEIGSPISRRSVVRADTFEDGIAQVTKAYNDYMETFGNRAVFSQVPDAPPPVSAPGPDEAAIIQAIDSMTGLPEVVYPENESPKLPRGRHKASCTCPRCETKKTELAAAA